MLDNFLQILPEVIFDAAEKLGGRCTGRFYALNAMENRVYDIEMEDSFAVQFCPSICAELRASTH